MGKTQLYFCFILGFIDFIATYFVLNHFVYQHLYVDNFLVNPPRVVFLYPISLTGERTIQ